MYCWITTIAVVVPQIKNWTKMVTHMARLARLYIWPVYTFSQFILHHVPVIALFLLLMLLDL